MTRTRLAMLTAILVAGMGLTGCGGASSSYETSTLPVRESTQLLSTSLLSSKADPYDAALSSTDYANGDFNAITASLTGLDDSLLDDPYGDYWGGYGGYDGWGGYGCGVYCSGGYGGYGGYGLGDMGYGGYADAGWAGAALSEPAFDPSFDMGGWDAGFGDSGFDVPTPIADSVAFGSEPMLDFGGGFDAGPPVDFGGGIDVGAPVDFGGGFDGGFDGGFGGGADLGGAVIDF